MNKTLATYFFLVIFLIAFIGYAFNKLFPLAIKHTIYYCQSSLRLSPYIFISMLLLLVSLPLAKVLLTYIQTSYFKHTLRVQSKLPTVVSDLVKKHGLKGKIHIISYAKPHAFCLGVVHPHIYLSSKLVQIMNEKELEAILIHEKYHLENNDNFSLIFLSFAKYLLFIFPFLSDIFNNFILQKEINADNQSISYMGSKRPLISAFTKLFNYKTHELAYVSAFSNCNTLEARVRALTGHYAYTPSYKWKNLGISIVSFFVVGFIFMVPIKKMEIHAKNVDEIMVCLDATTCSAMCKRDELMSHMNM